MSGVSIHGNRIPGNVCGQYGTLILPIMHVIRLLISLWFAVESVYNAQNRRTGLQVIRDFDSSLDARCSSILYPFGHHWNLYVHTVGSVYGQ